jgi:HAE1 family hydrophobic/amphiphilic exporter-1
MLTPVAVSEELIKTITKLETEYKKSELNLQIAKDGTVFTLKLQML